MIRPTCTVILMLLSVSIAWAADTDPQLTSGACQRIQGRFNDIGSADDQWQKGRRGYPTFWSQVLSRMPPKEIAAVLVEPTDEGRLRFRPVLSSNAVGEPPVELPVECISGQQTYT